MAQQDIDRLTADLSTIQNAMRLDKPYTTSDIPMMLMVALCGLLVIPLLHFTSWNHSLCFLLAFVPGAIFYCRQYVERKRNRAARPALWQEMKLGLLVAAFIAPIAFGWLYWIRKNGFDSLSTRGSVLFFAGAGLVIFGAIDKNRRSYIPGGISAAVLGLAFPWLSGVQVAIGGAIALIATGVCSAAIIWWQLQRDASDEVESE